MSDKPIDNGGPVFPIVGANGFPTHISMLEKGALSGISLRDYAELEILKGLISNPGGPFQASSACGWALVNCTEGDVVSSAKHMADAWMKARTA